MFFQIITLFDDRGSAIQRCPSVDSREGDEVIRVIRMLRVIRLRLLKLEACYSRVESEVPANVHVCGVHV